MISRRVSQSVLGLIWFLDGIFQLKPQMFTPSFVSDVIDPMSQGQPGWVGSLVNWAGHTIIGHVAIWNLLFAVVQLTLGLAFLFNYRIKSIIVMSLLWCAIVWAFGEGFGQILTGKALLLTGAPGAVLIYGLIAMAIWPKNDGQSQAWSEWGIRFAQVSLAVLWTAGFLLQFQHSNLTPGGLSQDIAVPWLAKVIGERGVTVSVALGLVELGLALLLVFRIRLRAASCISALLSVLFWWAGQSFGQVLTPMSTDFNSGLLMVLLAFCAYPNVWHPVRHWVRRHAL